MQESVEEIIQVPCPGCGLVFELTTEFIGQLGECTECGDIFTITDPRRKPKGIVAEAMPQQQVEAEIEPEAAPPTPAPPATETAEDEETVEDFDNTDTGAIPKMPQEEVTQTVKLSRSSIGMIPQVKDSFKFEGKGTQQTYNPASAETIISSTKKPKDDGPVIEFKEAASAPHPKEENRSPELEKKGLSQSDLNIPSADIESVNKSSKKKWWQFILFWKK